MQNGDGHFTRHTSGLFELHGAARRLQGRANRLLSCSICVLARLGNSGVGNGRTRNPRNPRFF